MATTITVAAKTLRAATVRAADAAAGRTTLPILTTVLLRVTDTEDGAVLSVTGTDLEYAVRSVVPVTVANPTAALSDGFCVQAKRFAGFVSSLPDHQPVELKLDKSLVVTSGRARATFPVVSGEEYPPFPGDGNPPTPLLTAQGSRLATAISAVAPFAAANDKGRPVLMAVAFQIKGNELLTLAADGFSCAYYRAIDFNVPAGKMAEYKVEDVEVLLPKAPATALAKLAKDAGEERVTLSAVGPDANPSGAVLSIDGAETIRAYVRAIEGPYPDIFRVIPKTRPETPKITATLPLLMSAVNRVTPFGPDIVNGCPVLLAAESVGYLGQATLTVSAYGAEEGEGVDALDCEAHIGEDTPLPERAYCHLASAYLTTALRTIRETTGSDQVFITLPGPLSPVSFRDGHTDYAAVIMPVHQVEGTKSAIREPEKANAVVLDAAVNTEDFAPEPEEAGVTDLAGV